MSKIYDFTIVNSTCDSCGKAFSHIDDDVHWRSIAHASFVYCKCNSCEHFQYYRIPEADGVILIVEEE